MCKQHGYYIITKLGLMAGCAFSDIKAATSITPIILMPLIIFSGFFANSKDFFVWIGWI